MTEEDDKYEYQCSKCGYLFSSKDNSICPHCGHAIVIKITMKDILKRFLGV